MTVDLKQTRRTQAQMAADQMLDDAIIGAGPEQAMKVLHKRLEAKLHSATQDEIKRLHDLAQKLERLLWQEMEP